MPSGFGARVRVFVAEAPSISLSLTTAARFSGSHAAVVLTSTNIPVDGVARVDGVTQAVSVRNSSTQITFTLDEAHTRVRGTKTVTWYSPSGNTSSLGANFVVTEVLAAEYDNRSLATITLGAGGGGTQVVSQTDLSGNGRTRTTGAGAGVVYAAAIHGAHGGITCPNTSSSLRSVALCTALQNRAGISMVRAIKSTNAAVAGRGCYGLTLNDAANNQFYIGGYSSLGTMGSAKWGMGASASNARRGSTAFTWSAGETWLESISTRNGGSAVLKKNNGSALSFDVGNAGSSPMGPNSVTIGVGNYADMLFSMDTGTQYTLYELYADYDMTAAEITQAYAYLTIDKGITVP